MIVIKNTQRLVPINVQKIRTEVQKILDALRYADFDVGIWLCSNQTIRKYNAQYRNKDKVTDILSFAYHPDLKPGQRIKPANDDDKNLGDLLIAPAYVQQDAPRWGHSFEQRMQILLVHGICHLLGYDHVTDEDYAVMKRKEKTLLKQLQEKRSHE